MLQNKYSFTVGKKGARSLALALMANHGLFSNSGEYFLCHLTLERLLEKLLVFCQGISQKTDTKIHLNKREALAFHMAFKHGFIDTTEVQVNEIFTAIDRTII